MKFVLQTYSSGQTERLACVDLDAPYAHWLLDLSAEAYALRHRFVDICDLRLHNALPQYSEDGPADDPNLAAEEPLTVVSDAFDFPVDDELHTENDLMVIARDGVFWQFSPKHSMEEHHTAVVPWSTIERIART
jgi:hypothetical protein